MFSNASAPLGAIQQAGGPQGAEALLNILGNQYGRQGELDNRSAMNNADNAAAQTRLETEIRLKQEAAVAEQQRQTGVDTGKEERLRQALVKGQTTGDWTDFYSMAPNAVGMPTQYDREQQSQDNAAAAASAKKDAEDKAILAKQLAEEEARKSSKNTSEQTKPPTTLDGKTVNPEFLKWQQVQQSLLKERVGNIMRFILPEG